MNEKFLQNLGNDTSLYPFKLAEQFPHIFSKLAELWDTDEIDQYLVTIVFDTRSDRRGFPKEVASELWKLQWYRLKLNSAKESTKKSDYWDWIKP